MNVLEDREESRAALENMLDLITQIADYICEHTSKIRRPSGSMVLFSSANDYLAGQFLAGQLKQKIEEFKKEFARAKEAFDRGIDIEILYKVHKLGECAGYT